ncbi:pentapeptide repeat-containing protein [Aquimarina sp. M1]
MNLYKIEMTLQTFVNKNFTNQDFSNQKLPGNEYDNCTFTNCDFTEANIAVITFLGCTFSDCNFTKVLLKQAAFRDECIFEDCKLLGANFSSCDAFMFSAGFQGCILDYASFVSFEIKNTKFIDCKMIGADFTEATIIGSEFRNCDLNSAVFEQTNAEKADFTSAIKFDIDPTQNKLKKAKFSKETIAGVLKKFDLIIE